MSSQGFAPQILPPWVRSLAAGIPQAPPGEDPLPPAPPGTVFALTAEGGWAVPPQRFELLFGRDEVNVNIPIGVNDQRISRIHGRLICHGSEWTVRNEGMLPMLFPGDSMLLKGQERLLADTYTPVFIGDLGRRLHAMEIRMVDFARDDTDCACGDETVAPATHPLSTTERLVLTALAHRYLLGLPRPQPAAWKQVAADMNRLPGDRQWNDRTVARVVAGVRERLSKPEYPQPVPGLLRDEVLGEPLGNALNDNLVRALLQNATLTPADLQRFGEYDD
jgi:hypothetical protein